MHLHPKEVFVLYFGVMAVLVVRRRLALTNIPPKCLQLKLYHMACAWEGESDGQNLAVNRDCNLLVTELEENSNDKAQPYLMHGAPGQQLGRRQHMSCHVLLCALLLNGIQHS